MHFVEGLVPVAKGPDATDDGADVELTARKESEDALPDWPVVAETALQGDIFLDQLVEVESQGLTSPTNLTDPACRADDFECNFQSGTGSGGINDTVAAEPVALHGPRGSIADDHFAAIAFGDLEAAGVLLETDNGNLCSAEAGHGCAKNTDGAGAEDDDAVAGPNVGIVDYGIVSDTTGLGEAGLFEMEGVGDAVEDAGWDADMAGHGPIHPVAETLAGGVEVVETAAAHGIVLIDDGGSFGDNAVAFLPIGDVRTEFDDLSSELMTQDDRVVYWPGMVPGPLV